MSFTDQKPRVVTEKEANASWGGHPNGEYFRCYICGHKFVAGDIARFVFGKGTHNIQVCDKCDSDDVSEKFKKIYEDSKQTHWWIWKLIDEYSERNE